ncbi:unnamed protein product [Paramecium primaurelia]|uniref:Major facilitator superfamily (MFS) profile domain-containing protein n=1 Tax=Paramecium primaurelia TaxID=5886 RepID=A0A8S1MQK4_PARPR|nr:unnamed protein product [Paramecium primaurelia]
MTSQVFPSYNQENENIKTDNGSLIISKIQNLRQQPSDSGPLTNPPSLINQRFTTQSQTEVEEDLNSFVHLTIILVAIQSGNFSIGYSLSYLSMSFTTLFSQITLKGSEIEEQGLFSAVLSIGQLIGAFATKPLLKYTTRNQSLLIADMFGVLSILQVIPNREVILAFRFCYGLCLGISTTIMAVYVKEICPEKYYEKFSVLASFLIAGGLFFVNFMGLGYINSDLRGENSYYWQIIFAIPALLHFLRSFIITVIYQIDSPDSLIEMNKPQSAKKILMKIYKPQFVDQIFFKCQQRVQNNDEQIEGIMNLFTKKHLKTVLIGCLLAFISTWCGLFALYSYCSQIFEIISDGDFTLNTLFILILGIVQLIPAFISKFVYRKIGNRSLLLYGLFLLIICQILIIGLSYSETLEASIVSFIIICFFSFLFALTLGPITFSMTPEINTSEGTYFCFVTLYLWQLIMLYIFPFMLDAIQISGAFIVFAILTFLSTIFFYFYVKETKGLNHDEIERLYGKL